MKKWQQFSDEEIKNIVATSYSMREAAIRLGYSPNSGSGATSVENMLKEKSIDYSHFNHNTEWKKGKRYVGDKKYTIEEVFIKDSPHTRRIAKQYILDFNLLPYKCEYCGNTGEWLGKPIALELHHKNGINNDHRLENLTFLCPNCHAQTDNYAGKNTAISKEIKELTDQERIQRAKEQSNNHCVICGTLINKNSKYCEECYHLRNRKVIRPSRDELKKLIRTTSFSGIAHLFNDEITDNGIRKWCDSYNLPRTKKEINSYSDEEWEVI